MTIGKCSCRKIRFRKIWCRIICFGKFGVGKFVSENIMSENPFRKIRYRKIVGKISGYRMRHNIEPYSIPLIRLVVLLMLLETLLNVCFEYDFSYRSYRYFDHVETKKLESSLECIDYINKVSFNGRHDKSHGDKSPRHTYIFFILLLTLHS